MSWWSVATGAFTEKNAGGCVGNALRSSIFFAVLAVHGGCAEPSLVGTWKGEADCQASYEVTYSYELTIEEEGELLLGELIQTNSFLYTYPSTKETEQHDQRWEADVYVVPAENVPSDTNELDISGVVKLCERQIDGVENESCVPDVGDDFGIVGTVWLESDFILFSTEVCEGGFDRL